MFAQFLNGTQNDEEKPDSKQTDKKPEIVNDTSPNSLSVVLAEVSSSFMDDLKSKRNSDSSEEYKHSSDIKKETLDVTSHSQKTSNSKYFKSSKDFKSSQDFKSSKDFRSSRDFKSSQAFKSSQKFKSSKDFKSFKDFRSSDRHRKQSRSSPKLKWDPKDPNMAISSLKSRESSWPHSRSSITSLVPSKPSKSQSLDVPFSSAPSHGAKDSSWISRDSHKSHFPSKSSRIAPKIPHVSQNFHTSKESSKTTNASFFKEGVSKDSRRDSEEQSWTPVDSPKTTRKFSFTSDSAQTHRNIAPITERRTSQGNPLISQNNADQSEEVVKSQSKD